MRRSSPAEPPAIAPAAIALVSIALAGITPAACVRGAPPPAAAASVEAAPAAEAPAAEAPALEGELAAETPSPTRPEPGPIAEPIVDLPQGTDLTLVHDGPAQAVLTAPGVVVIVEEDFRHVRAIDAQSGGERWRVLAQTTPSGRHTLHRVGERVFLHAGPRMIALDLASGRRLGESPAYYNGNDMGCRFVAEAGACAYLCDCVVQPVSCASGAEIGGGWRSDETHLYHDLAQGHDTVCFSPSGLVGGHGDLTVVFHQEGGSPEVAAVTSAGTVAWRSRALVAGLGRVGVAGALADHDLCWLGERAGALRVFRCSDGQALFNMSEKTDDIREGDVRGLAGGRLWIAESGPKGGAVAVRDGADGRTRWRKRLAAGDLALPFGVRVGEVYFGRPRRLLVLEPDRGREVFTLDLGERDALVDDRGGGYVRSGDDLQELDERGQLRRRRPRPLSGLWMATPTHLVTLEHHGRSSHVEVLRREDLTPALRLEGPLAQVDGEPAGPTTLVFALHRGERPARVLVLRG